MRRGTLPNQESRDLGAWRKTIGVMGYNQGVNRMSRRIAHLDMDAFYASVELLRHPELKGAALVIGGRRPGADLKVPHPEALRLREYQGRGVVTTCTYEARALGVHSGMGLMKAARYAPEALLLPPSFDAYRQYSRLFKAAAGTVTRAIEDRGIDEIYLEFTESDGEIRALGQRLKDAVKDATGLSCSLGIGPNKLLAKIASDLDKPDGLTVLDLADVPDRLWPLPVGKINGVGPKVQARLAALKVVTIGDLAHAPAELLETTFGPRVGQWLADCAQGRDDRPLNTDTEPKSLSRETTFEQDLDVHSDRPALSRILTALCDRLAADLLQRGHEGRTIGIKLRYADFRTVTRDHTLAQPTADAALIKSAARDCLKRVSFNQKLRLLGVRVGALCPTDSKGLAPSPQRELPF